MRQCLVEHPIVVDRAADLGVRDHTRGPARDELDLAVLERPERVVERAPRLRFGHPADGDPADDDAREHAAFIRPAEGDQGNDPCQSEEKHKDHGPARDPADAPPEGARCRGDRLCGGHP